MADVQTLLRVGKQALDANKVEQAVALLSAASAQDPNVPQVWFYLAAAFAKQGKHDMSCLCFLSVLRLVPEGGRAPQPLPQLRSAAADNLWLEAARVLPSGWSTALADVDHVAAWAAAAASIATSTAQAPAADSSTAAAAATGTTTSSNSSSSSSSSMPTLWCIGSLGYQALALAEALKAHSPSPPTKAKASKAPRPAADTVAYLPSNQLSAQLFDQVVKVNNAGGAVTVVDATQARQWAATAKAAGAAAAAPPADQKQPAASQQPQEQQHIKALLMPGYCRAQCEVMQLVQQLRQLEPLLQPTTAICPAKVVIKGYLAAAPHLTALNRVDVTNMAEDTSGDSSSTTAGSSSTTVPGAAPAPADTTAPVTDQSAGSNLREGLHLSAANAALQRPQRPAQVSRFHPVALTPTSTLLAVDLQRLVNNGQTNSVDLFDQLRQDVTIQVTGTGAADCIVWWMEYELQQGCSLSYAPGSSSLGTATTSHTTCADAAAVATNTTSSSSSGGIDSVQQPKGAAAAAAASTTGAAAAVADVLQPHRWQYIAYLQDSQGIPPQPPAQQTASSSAASKQPLLLGTHLQPGDQVTMHTRVTRTGATVVASTAARAHLDSSSAAACDSTPSGKTTGTGSNSSDGRGQDILPYHMSMLNDRARTRAYAQGIRHCVQQLLADPASPEDPPAAAKAAPPAAARSNTAKTARAPNSSSSSSSCSCCSASGHSGHHQHQQQQQESAASKVPVVLDVGAGTGLLSMLAARAGAPCVVGCEREPALAAVAQQLVANNGLESQVHILRKLSSQLTVARLSNSSSPAAASKDDTGGVDPADLPAPAALVVHEIFGTDPLSERVLPALAQIQGQLCSRSTKFLPKGFTVVAALASCQQLLAFQQVQAPSRAAACGGTNSSSTVDGPGRQGNSSNSGSGSSCGYSFKPYEPLLPRKVELQLDELGDQLQLLTEPTAVASFDFEQQWPVPLQGEQVTTLPLLQPVLLSSWMQAQDRREGLLHEAGRVGAAAAQLEQMSLTTPQQQQSSSALQQQQQQQQLPQEGLVVVSWFEADCGAGGSLSTRPGSTYYGHWQQSVELLPAAAKRIRHRLAGGAQEVELRVKWAMDRVMFTVE